jgi:hypothetical protein
MVHLCRVVYSLNRVSSSSGLDQAGRLGGNPRVEQLQRRCHVNEAAVAMVANKLVRAALLLQGRKKLGVRRILPGRSNGDGSSTGNLLRITTSLFR